MPVDPAAVQRSVHEFMTGIGTDRPTAARPVADGLKALVAAAAQVLGVDSVGVLLLDEHEQLRSVASSGPIAVALETAQQNLGVGPGVDTVRQSAMISVSDLAGAAQYAQLAAQVVKQGAAAVVSAPIWVNGAVVGNMNAIASRPHNWLPDEITAVEAYAGVVATLLQLNASSVRIAETAGGGAERGRVAEDGGRSAPVIEDGSTRSACQWGSDAGDQT